MENVNKQLNQEEYEKYIQEWKEENKELIESGKCRKVFTENLPRWKNGKNKGCINWASCINMTVYFIYGDTESNIKITDYIGGNTTTIIIEYNNNKYITNTTRFILANIGKVLGERTSEFKIEIGTKFKDIKRDIVITDREYRQRKDKKGSSKWYKYACSICGWTEGWMIESKVKSGQGCSCCGGSILVEGINDIPTIAPWMVKYFQGGYDEAKLYTKCGGGNINNKERKIYPVCPDCGRIRNKKIGIDKIYQRHSISCTCGDGIKYPEKFVFSVLEQLGVEFEYHKIFDWSKNIQVENPKLCGNKEYDFYFKLNNKNFIIETHGKQHYQYTGLGRSVELEQENDEIKEKIAINNKIDKDNYIIINCKESNLDFIKLNIMNSNLSKIFDLSTIDWNKVEEFAVSNLVKIACKYKKDNPKLSTTEIGIMMGLCRHTICSYLQRGNELKWCEYDGEREKIISHRKLGKNSKSLISIENGKIFESIKVCCEKSIEIFGIQLAPKRISAVCTGRDKTHNGLHFKFISDLTKEEYIKYDVENKLKELEKVS